MFRTTVFGCTTLIALLLTACGAQATPTYFVAPTMAAIPVPPPSLHAPGESEPAAIPVPTFVPPSPTPPCTDGLTYLQDLTVSDGSVVQPGELIDKQWQVSNSGSCDWDDRYHLRLVGGDSLGAGLTLPLYPARAGTEAIIRILFTAPGSSGTHESQWQAFSPENQPFGSTFYMQVVVAQ